MHFSLIFTFPYAVQGSPPQWEEHLKKIPVLRQYLSVFMELGKSFFPMEHQVMSVTWDPCLCFR